MARSEAADRSATLRRIGGRHALTIIIACLLASACSPRPAPTDRIASAVRDWCVSFPNETIDAVVWSRDSRVLLVSSTDRDNGVPSLRALDVDSQKPLFQVKDAMRVAGEGWDIAFGPDSEVYWIDVGDKAAVMRREQAGLVGPLVELPHPRFIYLTSLTRGLAAIEVGIDEGSEASMLVSVGPSAGEIVLQDFGTQIVESFAASADGTITTVALSDGPETPVRFETSGDAVPSWTVTPRGKLVGGATPFANGNGILYLDHDIGAVRGIMKDGRQFEVMARDLLGVRIASDGRLAYITLELSKDNSLCVTGNAITPPR